MNAKSNAVAIAFSALALFSNAPANAAVIYDNFSVEWQSVDISNLSYAAVFKSNINQTIDGIGARISAPNDGDLKFVLFDLGHNADPDSSGSLLFTQLKHFTTDAAFNYKYSNALSVNLVANEWYAVGAVANPRSNFTISYENTDYAAVGPTFTAYPRHNLNFLRFSDPQFNNGFGCCNMHYQLLSAAVPEPATWAMMVGGFALAGAALRRRRSDAAVGAA